MSWAARVTGSPGARRRHGVGGDRRPGEVVAAPRDRPHRTDQRRRIPRGELHAGHAELDDLGRAAGLQGHHAERLVDARHHVAVCAPSWPVRKRRRSPRGRPPPRAGRTLFPQLVRGQRERGRVPVGLGCDDQGVRPLVGRRDHDRRGRRPLLRRAGPGRDFRDAAGRDPVDEGAGRPPVLGRAQASSRLPPAPGQPVRVLDQHPAGQVRGVQRRTARRATCTSPRRPGRPVPGRPRPGARRPATAIRGPSPVRVRSRCRRPAAASAAARRPA